MTRLTRRLPNLTALVSFECAARHLSFKRAAEELGVTPGAVSHQIKALEADLGQKLFLREHRGVSLSPKGNTLYASVDAAFRELAIATRQLRVSDRDAPVRVGASAAVSTLWLSPAILRFWREEQDIAINQLVSDNGFSGLEAPDLSIRYGRDPDPDVEQQALFRDTLVPVCAPALARRTGKPSLAQLAEMRLVHLDTDEPNWTHWQDWFRLQGHDGALDPGIRVNNYMIALAMAEDGAGVVLGWKRLISPLLQRGTLVVLGDNGIDAPNRFHLVSRPSHQLSSHAQRLLAWLLADLHAAEDD